nr:MAG TPA: TniQ [Caudoviricetes sp.]
MHFTPKTYIFIAAYCHNVELLTPSTSFHPYRNYDFFCKPYANIRNWCPQCLGKLLSFLNICLSRLLILVYTLWLL